MARMQVIFLLALLTTGATLAGDIPTREEMKPLSWQDLCQRIRSAKNYQERDAYATELQRRIVREHQDIPLTSEDTELIFTGRAGMAGSMSSVTAMKCVMGEPLSTRTRKNSVGREVTDYVYKIGGDLYPTVISVVDGKVAAIRKGPDAYPRPTPSTQP